MISTPFTETQRLDALRRTGLLDTEPEPEFDELVQIAAAICDAPISLISLMDESREWFKAAVGLNLRETSREVSFCQYTIRQATVMVIEDAARDPRFHENPLVTGEMGIRFYAGMRVQSPDGQPLGSLCVIDRKPRTLTTEQQAALNVLARQVNARIELRMQRLALQQALADAETARTQLAASEQRFKAFMDAGPFLSVMKDHEGRLVYYNQRFADRFGIRGNEWIGYSSRDRFPPELAASTDAHDQLVRSSGKLHIFLEETRNPDGTSTHWRTYKFPCVEADGTELLGMIGLDVTKELARENALSQSRTELEEANRLLTELAATDPLTGLANRRIFAERLDLEFNRSRRKKLALSVLLLDLDNFKQRNDTYGHDEGDATLRSFADLLRRTARETDLVARHGGEEFIVLLPEADEKEAVGLAQRILDAVRIHPWNFAPVTVSIGASGLTDATPNAARLVTLADEALYASKREGKDRVVAYKDYFERMLADLKNKR